MKQVMFIVVLLMTLGAAANEIAAPTNAPSRIELSDQFNSLRKLTFPRTNLTFLTIADKAGSEQIEAWVTPIHERFGNSLAIEGIADVSAVPRPLRGVVRRKFQKAQQHPVMLDWSGETVKAFGALPDRVNVLVLDLNGNILARRTGKATRQAIEELGTAIEKALREATNRTATQAKPVADDHNR
jgi:hypothetical protein